MIGCGDDQFLEFIDETERKSELKKKAFSNFDFAGVTEGRRIIGTMRPNQHMQLL